MITTRWMLFFAAWLIPLQEARGEIEEIQISWNAFKCQHDCIQQINRHVGSIKGVQDLKIEGSSGIANMRWNPLIRLSYEPFRYAAAAVGINIITMRLRVKGTITHDSENIYVISHQDGTRFNLIGPLHIEPGRYIPKYNLATHPLSNEKKEQLLLIEQQGKSVIISGPLFLPSNYPLTLITEQIQVK
ncbi:MAG: hypothetical protein ACH350_04345 [Parachlamydiaceae bacterium]